MPFRSKVQGWTRAVRLVPFWSKVWSTGSLCDDDNDGTVNKRAYFCGSSPSLLGGVAGGYGGGRGCPRCRDVQHRHRRLRGWGRPLDGLQVLTCNMSVMCAWYTLYCRRLWIHTVIVHLQQSRELPRFQMNGKQRAGGGRVRSDDFVVFFRA